VHCVGGRHRTGVMTAIYRMSHDGLTGKQAFAEMKCFKCGATFLHPEFRHFIDGFKPTERTETVAAVANSGQ
jgi:protein tyrosine/serine phosphatase